MIVRAMASDLRLPEEYIRLASRSASHRYKTYQIKKRTKGYRTIDHPARELKLMQRWLVDNLFATMPVHDAVYSYRSGRNIIANANLHRTKNYLLRIDFSDFFPSILDRDVVKMLKDNAAVLPYRLTRNDLSLVTALVCKDGRLTIGAPSSPAITNAILYRLDAQISVRCKAKSVTYSRYADDLYFSTNRPNVLEVLFEEIKEQFSTIEYPRLRINREKTVFTSRKRQRKVTGVTLTSDRKLSIGRQRKRAIKSLVYKFKNGELGRQELSYLRGLLAYVSSVEPAFIVALEKKFGAESIAAVREAKLVARKKKYLGSEE